MSELPRRPPRPSRPSSCHKDGDVNLSTAAVDSMARESSENSKNEQGMCSETVVIPGQQRDVADTELAAATVAEVTMPSEPKDTVDMSPALSGNGDMKPEVLASKATDTGAVSSPAKTSTPVKNATSAKLKHMHSSKAMPPASPEISDRKPEVFACETETTDKGVVSSPAKTSTPVKHTTSAELKQSYSSKTRKAPPIPPPPSSASKDTLPLSADGADSVVATLPVKDHDGNHENEANGTVVRDTSPCSKGTSAAPVCAANNMSSKPTLTTAPAPLSPAPAAAPSAPAPAPLSPAPAAAPSAHALPTHPDSKPALKPKPVTAVSRESVGSEDSSCSPHSPRTVSRMLSGSEPSTGVAATVPPVYAVVNKSRTLRSTSDIDGSADSGGKPGDDVGKPGYNMGKPGDNVGKPRDSVDKPRDNVGKPGANVTVARSKSAVAGSTPPKKPPRTFAHSEYMRLKSLTLPRRSSDLGDTGDYEDVSVPTNRHEATDITAKTSEECVDGEDKMQRQVLENTEPLSDGAGKVRRQQTDKLPAPPRPPPPSFPDSQSSGSSSKSSVAEANTAAASPSKKSGNNRDSKSRRPERYRQQPGIRPSSVSDAPKPGIRPSSGSDVADDNNIDDDIYAVPGDVTTGSVFTTQRSHLTCDTTQPTLQRTV